MAAGKTGHMAPRTATWAKEVRNSACKKKVEVCEMQNAEMILQAIRKMGGKRIPLERVYRCLFSEDLLLTAYDNIAQNQGALTKGIDDETAEGGPSRGHGMSLTRIRTLIEALRQERFRFKPTRRVQIPKATGGTRPLSVPIRHSYCTPYSRSWE